MRTCLATRARPVARLALLALIAVGAWTGPTPAVAQDEPASAADQVVLSGTVVVRRGQTVGEVIVVNGRVSVGGVVRGDVVVVRGDVDVTGQVAGDVVVFDGSVTLRRGAFVGGDVVSPEEVQQADGATIEGAIRDDFPVSLRAPAVALGRFAVWVAVTVSSLVLGLLLLLFAPRAADAVFRSARDRRWRSAWLGLGLALGLPLVGALLVLTLAGLPLGVGVLLALALVYWIGYAWSAWLLGRWIVGPGRNRALTFAAGWAILRVIAVIPFLGGLTWFLGAAYGLGAMAIALWRARTAPLESPAWVGRTGTRGGVPIAASSGFEPPPVPASARPVGEPAPGPGADEAGRAEAAAAEAEAEPPEAEEEAEPAEDQAEAPEPEAEEEGRAAAPAPAEDEPSDEEWLRTTAAAGEDEPDPRTDRAEEAAEPGSDDERPPGSA